MLDRILLWLEKGADPSKTPESLYEAEKVEKPEKDLDIPLEEEELEIEV